MIVAHTKQAGFEVEGILHRINCEGMCNRYFVLITGASRGFGKVVSEELARQAAPEHALDIVLTARSESGLRGTAEAIDDIVRGLPRAREVTIRRESIDLEDLDTLEARLAGLFAEIDPRRYSRAVLFNNAATFSYVGAANQLPSLAALRKDIDLNVTSSIWITSCFARVFGAHKRWDEPAASGGEGEGDSSDGARPGVPYAGNVVVNVSSLSSMRASEFWPLYSAGKAARQMYHRVLALEQKNLDGLKVLNYSPGVMDTDMSNHIRQHPMYANKVRECVNTRETAEKCVRLALVNAFANGAHIDVRDEEPSAPPAGTS